MTSDYRKKFFTDVFDNNRWNSSESASGQGSETWATQDLVRDLPLLFEKYGIESMLDAPCGDFHWMRNVVDRSRLKYTGADIVDSMIESNQANFGKPATSFEVLDIAVDPLPVADLVFVRDLFIHLSLDLISNCLRNIARSDFKYVMLTHDSLDARYPPAGNVEIDDGNNGPVEHGVNFLFRAVSMTKAPFNLPPPLEMITEAGGGGWDGHKTMALWSIQQVREAVAAW